MTAEHQAMEIDNNPREWDSTSYHRVSRPQVEWGERVLSRLPLRGDETVLDAGCGTGHLTGRLLERLPEGHVIAADRSENMLRTAAEHLIPRFGNRVSFICTDLIELDLEEEVDAIFSTATFHWIPDHPRLFRTLSKVLKPGGRLLAQCGGGPNIALIHGRAAELMERPESLPFFEGWRDPWEFADDVTTAERLRQVGFIDIETSLEAAPTVLASAEEYREFLTTVILRAHLDRLPDANHRSHFVDDLVVKASADDPPFFLDYWRLNMQATRP